MNCKACGTTLTTEQKFCPVCGTAVEEKNIIQGDVAAKMSEQEFAKYPSAAPMCSKISTAVTVWGVRYHYSSHYSDHQDVFVID